ncbi:flagellar hook-basal body complex protein FliE [Bordetella holmesii]|uniref:Flagellar hook-basal body complex protein FliE n=2 Tax=Bordetella holmesii TaxID=35814 RepID=A0A158M145_9BORD|nr:flagellar hook-basal body complex protein FliE [Bordetella holmesii]AHV93742.1 flagellar hook-basal body complex protein FliE [Bordetella holmesii ATCC 51541]AIT28136.1 flagellar hook-basal body complex protein FliE [Bordetella holmesii 44057]EWM40920.1 flagellar hook-basal body complex protein FliE [Bordetella holmesii 35009]EWM44208.1 flagellar hook-basal body complex protein FliE [Bordetella holmesii 41130]EWM44813.1 flagellar hook-basal body complex protein FliE [Bordetella holmesii 701
MSVSGVSGIENMLEQMRAVMRAAQSGSAGSAELSPATAPASFAAALQNSIRNVSNAQNAATVQAKAFELGAPDVSLNDVMIDLQKASLGFQMTVQVRNRLVAAYKEISSMSI